MDGKREYQLSDLSELEYKLIINALKVWRGDFKQTHEGQASIWDSELTALLTKLDVAEKGWITK